MTTHSPEVLPSQLGTSLLFHVQFLLFLHLQTDFSGDRFVGLVFPSLKECSTVCCEPDSQRLRVVNKAEVDAFFWNSLAFFMIQHMLAIWSLVPLPFLKGSLNIWKFMVHVMVKFGLENFENYFASFWDECNCEVLFNIFGTAFFGDWNKNWPFLVLWPLLSFPNLLAYWVQHLNSFII